VLVAPRAEAQVFDRPRQPRAGGRERQHLADGLELFAGLAIDVDLARLRLEYDLASRRAAHAIALFRAHVRNFTGGGGGEISSRIGCASVRVLIFHGYLLDGTGSNVYNARLAAALVRLGHDVHLLSQDRHPERQPFVDAVGDWDGGSLHVRELGRSRDGDGRCTVYRPDIGGLLPVYVADRYEGIEARTFAECSDLEVARYVAANVAAVAELAALTRPQLALANHLVMGPVILARALAGTIPYAVKVHGSALEYTVKPQPERFLDAAREGLAGAAAVLVGSAHTAHSLWCALGDPEIERHTRLGPPGVDVASFRPREPEAAAAGLRSLAARVSARATAADQAAAGAQAEAGEPGAGDAQPAGPPADAEGGFARDELAAASTLQRLDPERDVLVAFVGKLIVSKGVDLLLAAWPLVLERVPSATLVIVGFGAYRATLEELLAALATARLGEAAKIARAGRSLEAAGSAGAGGEDAAATPLRHLLAFLLALDGERRERYLEAARDLPERVIFTGRLEHEELAELLPACEALVVPSTFPEAFGMVAAEGAACGALPVSAAHSGLAEVSDVLARAVPAEVAPWLSFAVDDHAVPALAGCLTGWLCADARIRAQTRAGLVAAVRRHWSWEGVARGVIAAARGELDKLPEPDDFARSVG
jgi:glycosyltransferase involved in cell wall biosynthesis